jgi:hypothetical protein
LAQRSDVLRKLILHLREIVPAALLIVVAGVSKEALEKIEGGLLRENLAHWSRHMRARGPEYAADALVRLLTAGHLRAPGEKKKERS